jgi:hypothetical protein
MDKTRHPHVIRTWRVERTKVSLPATSAGQVAVRSRFSAVPDEPNRSPRRTTPRPKRRADRHWESTFRGLYREAPP